jgi:hypothetical protein
MSEPRENPNEAATRKPFQYSLKSLFVITTLLAVALKVLKWQPWFGERALLCVYGVSYFYYILYLIHYGFRSGTGIVKRLLIIGILVILSPPLMLIWVVLICEAFHHKPFFR